MPLRYSPSTECKRLVLKEKGRYHNVYLPVKFGVTGSIVPSGCLVFPNRLCRCHYCIYRKWHRIPVYDKSAPLYDEIPTDYTSSNSLNDWRTPPCEMTCWIPDRCKTYGRMSPVSVRDTHDCERVCHHSDSPNRCRCIDHCHWCYCTAPVGATNHHTHSDSPRHNSQRNEPPIATSRAYYTHDRSGEMALMPCCHRYYRLNARFHPEHQRDDQKCALDIF